MALAAVAALPAPARPPALSSLTFIPDRIPTSAGHSLHAPLPPRALQIKEELAAAEARRLAVIAAQPALRLDLPAALQQPPPRLDLCSVCAGRFEKVRLRVGWVGGGSEQLGAVDTVCSQTGQHGLRLVDYLQLACLRSCHALPESSLAMEANCQWPACLPAACLLASLPPVACRQS